MKKTPARKTQVDQKHATPCEAITTQSKEPHDIPTAEAEGMDRRGAITLLGGVLGVFATPSFGKDPSAKPNHTPVALLQQPNVDASNFRDQSIRELLEKYVVDGFHVSKSPEDRPDDLGDAVIFTAIAAASMALQDRPSESVSFLSTLTGKGWHNGKPIRHPKVFEFRKVRDKYESMGNRPMPKDGLIGIMGACSVAQSMSSSPSLKKAAAELLYKHTRFLQENQWRTIRELPPEYRFKCEKPNSEKNDFCDVYVPKEDGDTVTYQRATWLGPEAFTFSPAERRALNAVASDMGIVLTHDQPENTLDNTLIQSLTDILSNLIRHEIEDKVLRHLPMEIKIPIAKPPVTTEVKFSISESKTRSLGDLIQTIVRETVRAKSATPDDWLVLIADRLLTDVPSWVGGSVLREGIRNALSVVLPWINRKTLPDLVYLIAELEIAKSASKSYGPSERHMAFWTTLAIYNSRPELRSLISLYLREFCKAVTGRHLMLFDWLAGNDARVAELLRSFESNADYQQIRHYAWNTRDREWFDADDKPTLHSRLDYLLLDGLRIKGRLPPIEEHFASLLKDSIRKVVVDNVAHCPTCRALGQVEKTRKVPCPDCFKGKIEVRCQTCRGRGLVKEEIKGCPLCRGTGKIKKKVGRPPLERTIEVPCPSNVPEIVLEVVDKTCPECIGKKVVKRTCPLCKGKDVIDEISKNECPTCKGRRLVFK